jgi:hypothetical protein
MVQPGVRCSSLQEIDSRSGRSCGADLLGDIGDIGDIGYTGSRQEFETTLAYGTTDCAIVDRHKCSREHYEPCQHEFWF